MPMKSYAVIIYNKCHDCIWINWILNFFTVYKKLSSNCTF